ncbi:CPBP family intramembrane glutamic endopeptidase [Naumannella cuiyingiana]|uniref:CAAX prenyl protease 2/Lysostaphin resistance protein A-like domain-containing protein n=1 Tax=Naumannella cuiyingiana TaxID=1347891 RepID=A0A7Z0DB46_9ACTN|nr:CPBP family intramembrane glutamic endopeptidase [Naumannella cuiyingiana]NYI72132.1 hypothetical protein [Naumannella cuiyingiana]
MIKKILLVLARFAVAMVIMTVAALVPSLLLIPVSAVLADPARVTEAMALKVASWLVVPLVVVALVAVVARYWDRRSLASLGLVFTRRTLVIGLVVLGASTALSAAATALAAALGARPEPSELAGIPPALLAAYIVARALFLQGFGEELIWRGWFQRTVPTGPVTAAVLSAIFFAVPHLLSGGGQQSLVERFLYLVLPFGFGLAAAGLALRTGSLWAAVGVHTGFHFGWSFLAVLGITAGGPIAWLLQGAAFVIVGVVALAGGAAGIARQRDSRPTGVPMG